MRPNTMPRKAFLRSVAVGGCLAAARPLGTGPGRWAIQATLGVDPAARIGLARAPVHGGWQAPGGHQEPPMARIAGGAYTIGLDGGPEDAAPAHIVVLEPFLIDQFEVTNARFAAFLNTLEVEPVRDGAAGAVAAGSFRGSEAALFLEGNEGDESQDLVVALDDENSRIGIVDGSFAPEPGFEEYPVAEVTWRGARDYAAWRGARLPTEVEWEAAARGAASRTYPWGEAPPTPARAVFGRGSGEIDPVGNHAAGASPEGVQDLAGNLAEWTNTLYWPYPYDPNDGREAENDPGERVTRGGDHVFDSSPATLAAYHRLGFSRAPGRGHRHIGFRCARSLGAAG